jgi:hypothetical protein
VNTLAVGPSGCYGLLLLAADVSVPSCDTGRGKAKTKAAVDVIRERLSEKCWPINPKTRYRQDMLPGQRLLFYAAGQKALAQHVVASAVVHSLHKEDPRYKSRFVSASDGGANLFLQLDNISVFSEPRNLRILRRNLSFIQLKGHYWYTSLQGGSALLTAQDWAILTTAAG